jgi:exosortase C (VPDSG-CTERM-specific)
MEGIKTSVALGADQLPSDRWTQGRAPYRTFLILTTVIIAFFAKPLYDLVRVALNDEINSHVILIPFISAYVVGQRRGGLPMPESGRLLQILAALLLPAGLVAITFFMPGLRADDILSLRIAAFCFFIFAAVLAALGWKFLRAILFPLCFLLFLIPLPLSIIDPLETASRVASTETYAWMMDLSDSSYIRHGFVFMLPGLTIEVAQECSGIRSSFVLFIVSLLAGNLFLSSTWRRIFFSLFVIPLGIVRNAFRIFTLSFLSVHWDPSVIHSPLHHRGGPLFFALSLIPFCLVLAWLRKSEPRPANTQISPSAHPL